MDFAFSEEQDAIRETARRFAEDRLAPGFMSRETTGRLDRDLMKEMGSLGLIAPEMPESRGGLGLDGTAAGIIIEEIAAADSNVAYVPLLNALMGAMIADHADPEIAAELCPKIVSGEVLMALGLTEPRGGSDAANLIVKAERRGDDYVLNGEKTSISLADQADWTVMLARTDQDKAGAGGVSAFVLSLKEPGISTGRFDDLGALAVGRGSIFFEDVVIPAHQRMGAEGMGFRQVMGGFDYSRALIGLQVLGAARSSLAETWDYVTERQAFGRPIAKFQGVTEPLAEAETLLAAATLLCYKTLWLRDQDRPHTAEAAMVKWWAPKVAFDIIHACLLSHGHMGYSREMPHQQRLRDVLGLQIGDGTAQIQKMIIARERIGRIAVPYD